jgi:phosphate transport system substrate-binding protein
LDAEQPPAPPRGDAGRRVLAASAAEAVTRPAAGTSQAAPASFTNTPAIETISLVNGSGTRTYPIVNYEYAIVSTAQGSAVRARDLRAFLSWEITSGAAQLAQVNFQPLPSSVVTLSGTQIAEIKG